MIQRPLPVRRGAHVQAQPQPTSQNAVATAELPVSLSPTLEVMTLATRYRDWIFSAAEPYLGKTILEVGAGFGTMAECVQERPRVIALEPVPSYVQVLRARFGQLPNFQIVEGDATDPQLMRSVEGGIDSAMSFNVFEHIEDDRSAMRNVQQVLEPGGHFVCFVPACKLLYGRMDQDLGHHRRYSKPELAAKAKEAGFEIVELKYVNLIGFFAWLVNGRLLRSGEVSGGASAMRLYDRFMVPLTRFIESHWQPPFGQSLLLVARKPIG